MKKYDIDVLLRDLSNEMFIEHVKKSKYIQFPGGRLCNQLFYCLALRRLRNDNKDLKILLTKRQLGAHISKLDALLHDLTVLGLLQKYYHIQKCNLIHTSDVIVKDSYMQNIGTDFSKNDVRSFVEEDILTVPYVKNIIENKRNAFNGRIAVHIRNTDYININIYVDFDRKKYFSSSIAEAIRHYGDCAGIDVYSDDIDYCKREFSDVFGEYSDDVAYISNSTLDDLLSIALHECKVIVNSTFSIWAAYISDCIFNRKSITIHPNKKIGNTYWPYMPHWKCMPIEKK